MDDFKVFLLNGFVNINTISPSKEFYYKIQKPIEVSMGVFASPIAFFDMSNNLIFSTGKDRASYLPPFKLFENVIWLNGELALFLLFKRNASKICIINLKKQIIYLYNCQKGDNIEELIFKIKNLKTVKPTELVNQGFKCEQINSSKNKFKETIFNKWYPKISG